jgi:hypothetical protein
MPLPTRTLPEGLPSWRVEGYEARPDALFGHAPMSTGHSRTRKRFTTPTRQERASLLLTDAQLVAFHEWHEGTLQAGLLSFAAQVCNLGEGMVWFDALLLDYSTESRPNGKTLLSCNLLLRGYPSATGPEA